MRAWRQIVDQYEGNPDPDLTAYRRAGHLRYMHKATEGCYHIDEKYHVRVREAHSLGLFVNHYHFCRPDQHQPIHREMGFFWDRVRPLWLPGDRLCLDCEEDGELGWVGERSYIEALWTELKDISGVKATIYGSTTFLAIHVDQWWLRSRDRHEAAYGPPPTNEPWKRHWWAWQYTDGTTGPWRDPIPGIGLSDVSMLSMSAALADRARWLRRRQMTKGKLAK